MQDSKTRGKKVKLLQPARGRIARGLLGKENLSRKDIAMLRRMGLIR